MITGIQLFGIVFGLFMLYYSYLHIRRKEFTTKETLVWMVLWVLIIVLSLFPRLLDKVAWGFLNLSRTLDLIIIIGFLFLMGIVFYLYALVRINQKRIDNIVRNMAIEKADKEEKARK